MDEWLVHLRMHGLDARNGRVPTEAFTGIIRRFAATIALFERAFNARTKRSIDLTVATLRRENPLIVGMQPEARSAAHPVDPAMVWTFAEIDRIADGAAPDERLPIEALDNLVSLSDAGDGDRKELTAFQASYRQNGIQFDARLAAAAKAQRKAVLDRMPPPAWFAGVSRGTLLGELRGVTDLAGEREFFIRVPAGGRNVRCVFAEPLRQSMNRLLFQPVRVAGLLHFDGSSPHANLVEAAAIDALDETARPHLLDLEGLFEQSFFPPPPEFPQ